MGLSVSVFSLACVAGAAAVSGLGGILAAGGAYLLMFVGLGVSEARRAIIG